MIQNIPTVRPYSARLLESRTWSIALRHFQWPWTVPNPDFKVKPLFDAECLRNGTRYRQLQWDAIRDLHTPHSMASFQTTLSALVLTLLTCAYIVRPYLEVNPHDKAQGLADSSMKKLILVHLILFSLFLKQFRLGASTVSWSKLFHLSMTRFEWLSEIFINRKHRAVSLR